MATNNPLYDPEIDPELEELIEGYVLGILTPDERSKIEGVLSMSQKARAVQRVYQEAFGGYAALTPPRKAPADGEAKLRARLAANPQQFPASVPITPNTPSGYASVPPRKPTVEPARVQPARRRLITIYAALAAVFLIVIGGVIVYAVSTREGRTINAIIQDPKAVRVAFQPQTTPTSVQGRVSAVAVPGDTRMVLLAELPPLNANQQYQLWFIEGKNVLSGGVFASDQTERRLLVEVPSPTQAYTLGVTVEPAGGSPQPTQPPIFTAQMPALK